MPERSRHKLLVVLTLILGVAVLGVVALQLLHHRREAGQRRELARAAQAGPRVVVEVARPGDTERTVVLPGDVRAFNQVQLTARISGYLRRIVVDVGSRVTEGQLLAVLESPEIEQQVRSAQADLENKKRLASRLRRLAKKGFVNQQDADAAEANARIAEANYRSSLDALAYATLRAPFSGVVTARYADPGALLQPGAPLVELRDPDRLRVSVFAGQDVAPFLAVGDAAEIRQDELPDRVIQASVSRVAGGLDDASRTMRTELWVDNQVARLVPGVFVHVTLHVRTPPLPIIPAEAVVTRDGKTLVGMVENDRIHFRPVVLGINEGATVQVRSGLQPGAVVALNPPTELREGSPVQPVRLPAAPSRPPPRNARTPTGR